MQQTYWNGEPTPARKVDVIVGPVATPTWWCAGLTGQQRKAVEVTYGEDVFYLDNEDGSGWDKVTVHKGGPWSSHKSLPVERVVD